PTQSFHRRSRLLCEGIGPPARLLWWRVFNCQCRDCISPVVQRGPVIPSPHNHFSAPPDCRVTPSPFRRIGGTGCCPSVSNGVVPTAGVRRFIIRCPAPDN